MVRAASLVIALVATDSTAGAQPALLRREDLADPDRHSWVPLLQHPDRRVRPRCPRGRRIHVGPYVGSDGIGNEVTLRHGRGGADGDLGIVRWRRDVNGDGVPDLAMYLAAYTGNHGDVLEGVYVACGGDAYVAVWGPDYVQDIELVPGTEDAAVAPGTWRPLRFVTVVDNETERGFRVRVGRFDGRRYRSSAR